MHNQQDTPHGVDHARKPGDLGPLPSSDYFAFYQDGGRWAWRRVSQADAIVDSSSGTFAGYMQCIADARKHGWKGKPVGLCLYAKKFSAQPFSADGARDSRSSAFGVTADRTSQ